MGDYRLLIWWLVPLSLNANRTMNEWQKANYPTTGNSIDR
jgi:hypothetical protein